MCEKWHLSCAQTISQSIKFSLNYLDLICENINMNERICHVQPHTLPLFVFSVCKIKFTSMHEMSAEPWSMCAKKWNSLLDLESCSTNTRTAINTTALLTAAHLPAVCVCVSGRSWGSPAVSHILRQLSSHRCPGSVQEGRKCRDIFLPQQRERERLTQRTEIKFLLWSSLMEGGVFRFNVVFYWFPVRGVCSRWRSGSDGRGLAQGHLSRVDVCCLRQLTDPLHTAADCVRGITVLITGKESCY